MTYFADLTEYDYFARNRQPGTKNVGWLERGHSFDTAAPSLETLDLLWTFCSITVMQTRGIHRCDLCVPPAMGHAEQNGLTLGLGSAEIRVFSDAGATYGAPNLIYHYVKGHHYRPPDEFLHALRSGPRPPSLAYFDQLNRIDPDWREQFAEQALRTYRELAKAEPAYLSYVAKVLSRLGGLYQVKRQPQEAEEAFTEGLAIYRELARADPAYLPKLAKTLNRVGYIYAAAHRLEAAERAHKEALVIYRELAKTNPGFLFFMTAPLKSLRDLLRATHRPGEAAQAEDEDNQIRRELAEKRPEIPWH